MNRNHGATIGAILLAGLLLRPIAGNNSEPPLDVKQGSAPSISAGQQDTVEEGPWIASCKYWSPVRPLKSEPAERPDSSSKVTAEPTGPQAYRLHLEVARSREATCPSDSPKRWGLPVDKSAVRLRMMIATVPDPVHSRAALQFDRTIDALVEAAEDNRYTSSYLWLPWRSHVRSTGEVSTDGDKEPGHDAGRERKPGLIIFKHVPPEDEQSSLSNSYYKVTYLFLVSETATQGINGDQMKRALSYEDELEHQFPNPDNASHPYWDCNTDSYPSTTGCSSRGRDGKVAIIGPAFTGSAASLRASIETHFSENPAEGTRIVEAAGATSSVMAERQLAGPDLEHSPAAFPNRVTIQYESFNDNSSFEHNTFRQLLLDSEGRYDPRRVFELVEDNTARGESEISNRQVCDATDNSGDCIRYRDIKDKEAFTVLRYPREISLLRNAQSSTEANASDSAKVPSPYLPLSLKDTTLEDSAPHFSREDTPLSQEAELMAIARTLNRSRAQFVLIVGSNVLDELFLMQFLRRSCPDVRLLFMGGDLLLEREVDNVPYIGSVTVSAYPLIGTGQGKRAYSDSSAVAFYNAASYSFWDLGELSYPPLTNYRNMLQRDDRSDFKSEPQLWETVIGSDGYYPLALLNGCSSNSVVGRDRPCGCYRLCLSPLVEPAVRNSRNGLPRLLSRRGCSHTVVWSVDTA